MLLPQSPTLRFLYVLQLQTFNFFGGAMTAGVIPTLRETVKTALDFPLEGDGSSAGEAKLEWLAAVYADHPGERRKGVRWARVILLFHGSVLALAIIFQLWLLPVLISLGPFIANWWRYLVWMPMHCGLRDNVADFRKCTRSIKLDPLTSLLYFRMNWHMEHHMYAGVPCYNLRRLSEAIAADLPQRKSVLGAWREMRATWKRQQVEPGYQYDVPLPATAHQGAAAAIGRQKSDDALGSSIGDLAPAVIATG